MGLDKNTSSMIFLVTFPLFVGIEDLFEDNMRVFFLLM